MQRLAKAGACEVAIERGDGPVVDALLAAGVTVVVITPRQIKNLRSRYGSAGNKDDRLRRVRARGRAAHRPGPAAAADTRQPGHRHAAAGLPGPPGPGPPPGRGDQPAARPPACPPSLAWLACSAGSTRRSAWRSWPASAARTAAGWLSLKRLAAWLKGAGYSGRTDPADLYQRLTSAPRGATGEAGSRQRPGDPRPGRRAGQPEHPDQGPGSPDRRPARRPRRRPHLHLPAPLGHRPRRPPARRDRRLPGPVPRTPGADLPGRRRAVHPPVRQAQSRHLPLGRQQTAARCGLRLRRRLPPRQPLGRPASTTPRSPAGKTTPTRCGSSPAPGCMSSGTAGTTATPTTQPATAPCSGC